MELRLRAHAGHQIVDLPWQKNAPSHWKLHRIKHLLREVDERTSSGDEPLLSLTRSRGLIRRSEVTDKPPSAKTLIGYKICRPGDIVMNRMQAWSGMFGLATELGIVSPDYAVLRLTSMTDGDFLLNLLKAPGPVSHFAALSTGMGSGFNRLYTDQLGAVPVVIPPYEEQVQIAAVIRRVDHRVNRLIRAKQRLIALLNEQKQAIIQRAVTRGLDPDVRFKPSGVEWLGEVPEHWEVLRTKFIYSEVDERSKTGEETHLSMSQKHGLVRSSSMTERATHSESYVGGKLCERGDLVLNRLKAHLGVFAVAPEFGVVSPDYSVFRLRRPANERYFELVLRTPAIRSELRSRVKGIVEGLWRLYTPDFFEIPLPVPPLGEQVQIVDKLATDLAHVENTIRQARTEIDLISEYRTRLIADVVTGKLDVRGVKLPDFDDTEGAEDIEDVALVEEEFAYAGK